jgi:hypothetical protein
MAHEPTFGMGKVEQFQTARFLQWTLEIPDSTIYLRNHGFFEEGFGNIPCNLGGGGFPSFSDYILAVRQSDGDFVSGLCC